MEGIEDGELAKRIAQGDRKAEAELYRRLAPRARLYGLRHLRDRHAAHDLAQHVLLATLERLRAGEVREPEKIASFVLGMCRMTVLEMRRTDWRREQLMEQWGDKAEAYDAPEPLMLDEERLNQCLEALAERERSVVALTFLADKDGDEVGRELDITPGNVRVIRHRAISKLRQCMGAAP